MKKLSTHVELTAAAATAGITIENLRSRVCTQAAGNAAFCTPAGKDACVPNSCYVRDLIAPVHEVGESWTAVVCAANGKMYEQDFTITVNGVAFVGEPREVVAELTYAPVPAPAPAREGARPTEASAPAREDARPTGGPAARLFALEAGEMMVEAPSAEDTFKKGFMVMAGGVRTVTLGCYGQPLEITINVTAASAAALQKQLEAVNASTSQRVFNCFDHGGSRGRTEASSWPQKFFWDAEKRAVYEIAEPSKSGLEAVDGKKYRGFSMTFFTNAEISEVPALEGGGYEIKPGKRGSKEKPADIICPADARTNPTAYLNMGTMTNKPAFSANEPLFASQPDAGKNSPPAVPAATRAGAQLSSTTNNNQVQIQTMKELNAEALQARNQQLEQKIAELSAADTAVAKAELRAAQAELEANQTQLQLAKSQEKLAALEAAETKRKERDADTAVALGVEAQIIPMLDKELQASWRAKFVADPTLIPMMTAQWQGAKAPRRTPHAAAANIPAFGYGDVKPGAGVILKHLEASLQQQRKFGNALDANTNEKRSLIARDIATIYRNEVRSKQLEADEYGNLRPGVNPDFLMAPLEAATDADNLGTLAGTLVSMRYLDIFMYKLPLIGRILTDFSDQPSELNQVFNTRKVVVPGVISYDNTLDTDGYPKGWQPVSAPQTADVNITMDELIGSPIQYDLATLSSTQRQLFMEQAPAAAYANALYFMKKIYAVCTAANFNSYAAVTAADSNGIVKVPIAYPTYPVALIDFARSKITEVAAAFDTNEVPDEDRTMLLNAQYYNKATTDPSVTTFFAGQQAPEVVTQGRLPSLAGFVPIKAPNFPGTNNRFGLFLQKNGLLAKSRLPNNLNQINPGSGNGSVTQIVHAETGVAMLLVQWVDHKRGYSAWLPCAILGAAPGDKRGGLVGTTQ